MGTWSAEILGNDDSADLYYTFEELYFNKEDLDSIKNQIKIQFNLIEKNGNVVLDTLSWTAYALICWECNVLDEFTLKVIEKIANEKTDIEDWENLKNERQKVIVKFLKKISTPIEKIKKIPKKFNFIPPFKQGDCITFQFENSNYGGAICFQIITENKKPDYYNYIIGITRINQNTKPILSDFINSHILVYNYGKTVDNLKSYWIDKPEPQISGHFTGKITSIEELNKIKSQISKTEIIGNLKVISTMITNSGSYQFYLETNHFNQFEWEKENSNAIDLSFPVSKYCELI